MAAAGVFGPELAGPAAALTYWHLSGGFEPGKETKLFKHDPARTVEETEATERALIALIAAFDDPDRAYLSRPHPGAAPRFSDYTQLARVAEWAALEDDE